MHTGGKEGQGILMKIGIVGSGLVGATAAYALVMRGVGREVVLVDRNMARAQAEADDIFHAVPFAHPMRVTAGEYADLKGCRVIIIAAGVSQKPGETRLQLLGRNAAIFRQLVPEILTHAPDAVLIVATNPVDIMTHLTARFAAARGVPPGRVLGSGTTLDTARFRALLSRHLGVDAQHIHAYVVGEHGDSEVLTWSMVGVGGIPLDKFCHERNVCVDDEVRQRIDQQVRRAAYNIINGKGSTYYGIASALARIVDVILRDQQAILTVCAPLTAIADVNDVTLSIPHLVGGNGILEDYPLPIGLSAEESALLHNSASIIRSAITELDTELASQNS
jgi:L-lactate dehydrogenase